MRTFADTVFSTGHILPRVDRAPVARPGTPPAAVVRVWRTLFLVTLAALAWLPLRATWAQQAPSVELVIQDDQFSPAQLHVPANQRVELRIRNTRKVPAEFESPKIGREKVVPGGTTLSLWIGPLKPGEYEFFDEFNPASKGKLIVAPAQGNGSGS